MKYKKYAIFLKISNLQRRNLEISLLGVHQGKWGKIYIFTQEQRQVSSRSYLNLEYTMAEKLPESYHPSRLPPSLLPPFLFQIPMTKQTGYLRESMFPCSRSKPKTEHVIKRKRSLTITYTSDRTLGLQFFRGKRTPFGPNWGKEGFGAARYRGKNQRGKHQWVQGNGSIYRLEEAAPLPSQASWYLVAYVGRKAMNGGPAASFISYYIT